MPALRPLATIVLLAILALTTTPAAFAKTVLEGDFIQGGLVIGLTDPGGRVSLDGEAVRVGPDGQFLFGFTRDASAEAR